jgi:hypothetical protein
MGILNQWWHGLTLINQWFYCAAIFFGVFFLWQLIMTFLGLTTDGGSDLDTQPDPSWDHPTTTDAHDTMAAFKLVSLRSVVAFFTLFTWAGALYMNTGKPMGYALTLALIWGLVAMVLVALLVRLMGRMTESGNMQIASCVGSAGAVYLDIPAGGVGEIKTMCNGMTTHFKARAAGGGGLKAGSAVRVLRIVGPNVVEVEEVR